MRRNHTCSDCYTDDGKGYKQCDPCKKREFEEHSSYCRCGQEVTNAAFFKKSSPHFKGTCARWGTPRGLRIPERTVDKKLPYPMPPKPAYDGFYNVGKEALLWREIDMGKLCAYWGVPTIGDGWEQRVVEFTGGKLPEGEGRWIKALFAGKCLKGHAIEANERAFYYRESRQILCADCGQGAAQRRAA